MSRVLVVVSLVLSVGCATAGTPKVSAQQQLDALASSSLKSTRQSAGPIAVKPAKENPFASVDLEPRRADVTYATGAFDPKSIDVAAVSRVIKQRLGKVEESVFRDLIGDVALKSNAAVADIVDTVGSLATTSLDTETASQTLIASISRSAAAVAVSVAVDDGSCTGAEVDFKGKVKLYPDRIEAAYEGLAMSAFFQPIGFPKADGEVAKGCENYRDSVAQAADALMFLGRNTGDSPAAYLKNILTALDGVAPCKAVSKLKAYPPAPELRSLDAFYRAADAELGNIEDAGNGGDEAAKKCAAGIEQLSRLYRGSRLAGFARQLSSDLKLEKLADVVSSVNSLLGKDVGLQSSLARLEKLVTLQPMRRGDVQSLIGLVHTALASSTAYQQSATVKNVVDAVAEELPKAIKEDVTSRSGIRLDAAGLSSRLLARLAEQQRTGLYLRATIGAGYFTVPWKTATDATATLQPIVHEELGVGYRWSALTDRVLVGPHIAFSGVLHQFVLSNHAPGGLFWMVGGSANVYRLMDVSVSLMRLFGSSDPAMKAGYGFVFGLQIPLGDYLAEVDTPAGSSSDGK